MKEKTYRYGKLDVMMVTIMLIFMNWFTFEMISRYGTVVPPTEITWVMGIFTGIVIMEVMLDRG